MSWTEITREQYRRDELRYASDTTDDEWALLVPFMPERKRLGRPREVDLREIVNALFYIAATGCQWRALPIHFPARSRARVLLQVAGRWHLGVDQCGSGQTRPRGAGTRAGSLGRRDRQPKHQNDGKWRPTRV